MSYYSIKQFSEITGITKFVLRTWENRYDFLKPERTESNIRVYTDEMLVRALNINLLLKNKYKISKICKLDDSQIAKEIENLEKNESGDLTVQYINEIIISCINFNGVKFNNIYNEGVKKFGLKKFYKDVLLITMQRIGILWLSNQVSPSQEHFLSEQIKQKISASINDVFYKKQTGKNWLLFLPENEFHEIGLLFAKFILVKNGHNVIYLGSNVPYESLNDVVKKQKIDAVLFFAVTRSSKNNLSYTANYLSNIFKNSEYYVISNNLSINKDLISNLKIIESVDGFVEEVSSNN